MMTQVESRRDASFQNRKHFFDVAMIDSKIQEYRN